MAVLSPVAKQQFFDNDGNPAAGYLLYTYATGTSTPLATYSNKAGTVENANPVVLDSRGEAIIYLDPSATYDYVLKTAAEATVWTREGVSAASGDADAVAFVQSGEGAVSRSIQDKAREVVSAFDFIPVAQQAAIQAGTSTYDCVADLHTAMARASARGAELRIPAGTYPIASGSNAYGLLIDLAGLMVRGDGFEATKLVYTSSAINQPAVKITADGVHLVGLSVDGSANSTDTAETTANCNGIDLVDVDDCLIDSCKVVGGHYGFFADNDQGDYSVNRHNRIVNCVARNTSSYGFHTVRASHSLIMGCDARDCGTDGFKLSGRTLRSRIIGNTATGCNRDGFDFYDGLVECVVNDNVSTGNTLWGYEIKGTFDGSDYVVRDSTFTGNTASLNAEGGFGIASVRNSTFTGNVSTLNSGSGFYLSTLQGCVFSGCVASKNLLHGFDLDVSISRTILSGCYAVDNSWDGGTTQNGVSHGFNVESGCAATFTGCSAGNGSTAGIRGGQGYGFFFNGTGNYIANCYALSNITGGFGGAASFDTNNTFFSGFNEGAVFGLRATGTGLNTLVSDSNITLTRASANATFTGTRTGGASVQASAQSSSGIVGTTSAHPLRLMANSTGSIEVSTAGHLQPVTDNTHRCGNSANRWTDVYAVSGSVNTSDAREKQGVAELGDAERRVAQRVRGLIRRFRRNDEVASLGEDAPVHIGVMAQEVVEAFAAEGLDAMRYKMIDLDQWPATAEVRDESGAVIEPAREAGNRYGVRYDQLLAFVIAAI